MFACAVDTCLMHLVVRKVVDDSIAGPVIEAESQLLDRDPGSGAELLHRHRVATQCAVDGLIRIAYDERLSLSAACTKNGRHETVLDLFGVLILIHEDVGKHS